MTHRLSVTRTSSKPRCWRSSTSRWSGIRPGPPPRRPKDAPLAWLQRWLAWSRWVGGIAPEYCLVEGLHVPSKLWVKIKLDMRPDGLCL